MSKTQTAMKSLASAVKDALKAKRKAQSKYVELEAAKLEDRAAAIRKHAARIGGKKSSA